MNDPTNSYITLVANSKPSIVYNYNFKTITRLVRDVKNNPFKFLRNNTLIPTSHFQGNLFIKISDLARIFIENPNISISIRAFSRKSKYSGLFLKERFIQVL